MNFLEDLFIFAMMFMFGLDQLGVIDQYGTRPQIITAITDNGQASHQELKPTVKWIDNYNLNSLGGE